MQIVEVGQNEDGEHAVTLVGTKAEVKAAAALFGDPVALVRAAPETAAAKEPTDA